MHKDDFASALQEVEDLLWAAQPDVLQAGMHILACQVAYARRHSECLPIDEIKEWLETGRKVPKKREILTEGMEQLVEVLESLGVESAKKTAI